MSDSTDDWEKALNDKVKEEEELSSDGQIIDTSVSQTIVREPFSVLAEDVTQSICEAQKNWDENRSNKEQADLIAKDWC